MTFKIPAGVLAQHVIALGKTRSGKSSKMRLIVERLLREEQPVCIVDPKGDWWGLKSSADGKSEGFPVVIFGGERADVPINARSGAAIAELVATGNRPSLIDLGGWRVSERTQFFIDFAESFFKMTKGQRYLVIDEVHNFAPKGKVLSPQAGEMLHWANRLASEGQGKGVILIAASQRPQKVHNDFLTSCETLIACRVIHKSDRDAVKDWIDGCADPELGKQVLSELAGMKRPEAWVWSPEIDFGPKRMEFPMFETFDSFKPREAHAAKLKGWAEVNLDEVKSKLAAVVQEAQANDPAALKKRIAELERFTINAAKSIPADAAALERAEKRGYEQGLMAGQGNAVSAITHTMREALDALSSATSGIEGAFSQALQLEPMEYQINRANKAPARARSLREEVDAARKIPVRSVSKPANGDGSSEVGAGGKRRILAALAQYPDGMNQRKLSILVDIAPKGGTWRTYMADLRREGWVEGGKDHMRITTAGLGALGDWEPLPTGEELVQYWRNRLGDSGKRAIFDAVVARYPDSIDVDEVSRITGIARAGGTWRTYMAELRGLGIIEGRGDLQAASDLFS
ncbi:MAG TPA: DUF87 domain-containing protein [Bradyrhizobium sp.]|jgi:hypothetical protein